MIGRNFNASFDVTKEKLTVKALSTYLTSITETIIQHKAKMALTMFCFKKSDDNSHYHQL